MTSPPCPVTVPRRHCGWDPRMRCAEFRAELAAGNDEHCLTCPIRAFHLSDCSAHLGRPCDCGAVSTSSMAPTVSVQTQRENQKLSREVWKCL